MQYVIIVAGGSGMRMGSAVPKQFLLLNGKPIISHTLERYQLAVPDARIIVVIPAAEEQVFRELLEQYNTPHPYRIVPGGPTRFHSVLQGLSAIDDSAGLVAVHDAVRPLVRSTVITAGFEVAHDTGAAIPVVALKDSIREIQNTATISRDRSRYLLVQTPQVFDLAALKKAYERPFQDSFTDDASVMEAAGYVVSTFPGNEENIKITSPSDLSVAAALLPLLD